MAWVKVERGGQQVGLDPLALARQVPVAQGGHHAEGGDHPDPGVVVGGADVHGHAVLGARREERQPRQRLSQGVEAAVVAHRSGRAERHVLQVDQARVDLAEVLVGDAVAGDVGRLEGDQHDVGPEDQRRQRRPGLVGPGEVEADAALAPVDDREDLRLEGGVGREVAGGVAGRRLDLHHQGAEVGQQLAAVRHRVVLGDLEHLHTVQRSPRLPRVAHVPIPLVDRCRRS